MNYKTNSVLMVDCSKLMEMLKAFHLDAAVSSKGAPSWVSLYEDSVIAYTEQLEREFECLYANSLDS
jgi:hypothetical protein